MTSQGCSLQDNCEVWIRSQWFHLICDVTLLSQCILGCFDCRCVSVFHQRIYCCLWCNVYELCPADHVRGVGALHVADLAEAVVTVLAIAGHAVMPAVMVKRVRVVRTQNHRHVHHIHRNADHVHQNSSSSIPKKTAIAGMQVRSAILKLLTVKLLVGDKHICELKLPKKLLYM